jgi:hypothetical protein
VQPSQGVARYDAEVASSATDEERRTDASGTGLDDGAYRHPATPSTRTTVTTLAAGAPGESHGARVY